MIDLKLVKESKPIELKLEQNSKGGTKNYNELDNKPTINGKTLQGNLTLDDLGIIVNTIKDILINGASIVDKDGNANIPIANVNTEGVGKANQYYGIEVKEHDKIFRIVSSKSNEIDVRTNDFKPITPYNLDYALKQGMCDGKGPEWTSEEKASARARMGLEWTLLGDVTVEEDGVTKIELPIDNPNYNEYQFYVYVADRKTPTAQNMNIGFDGVTSTSYCLTYAGVGTNTNYFLRAHTWRNCKNGWLTLAMGSKDGKPCSQSHIRGVDYYYKDSTNPSAVANTEKPYKISVSLSTGLDIGSKFVVYAR